MSHQQPASPSAAAPRERDPLILAVKMREMMGVGYEILAYIPKYQKHALGADIRNTMTTMLRLTYRLARRYHKKTTLEDLIIEVDVLKSQVLLASESRYIDAKKHARWAKLNDEIGRIVGGWKRRIEASQPNHAQA